MHCLLKSLFCIVQYPSFPLPFVAISKCIGLVYAYVVCTLPTFNGHFWNLIGWMRFGSGDIAFNPPVECHICECILVLYTLVAWHYRMRWRSLVLHNPNAYAILTLANRVCRTYLSIICEYVVIQRRYIPTHIPFVSIHTITHTTQT